MSDQILVKLDVKAPTPLMHRDAAAKFNILRAAVKEKAGFDFLGKCGDIFRPADFRSSKDGVANRSWHKTGRAFDYDQESKNLIIVSEPRGGKQYFRTFLICAKQDGSLGVKRTLTDIRGFTRAAFVVDFTAQAEAVGFERIPAWNGWQSHYNRREFWHYCYAPGLTWDSAMLQLRDKARPVEQVFQIFGLNDRGVGVTRLQQKLAELNLLPQPEVDGVFGAQTKAAVEKFQRSKNLPADGIVGAKTMTALLAA